MRQFLPSKLIVEYYNRVVNANVADCSSVHAARLKSVCGHQMRTSFPHSDNASILLSSMHAVAGRLIQRLHGQQRDNNILAMRCLNTINKVRNSHVSEWHHKGTSFDLSSHVDSQWPAGRVINVHYYYSYQKQAASDSNRSGLLSGRHTCICECGYVWNVLASRVLVYAWPSII